MISILLVDDEKNFIDGVAQLLEDKYNCYVAYNGKEALETLKTTHIDAVVTDILMPVMDGYELLAAIKKDYPNLPSIVISAHAATSDNDKIRKLGAKNFILKPIDTDQLSNMIDGLFETSSLKKERDELKTRLEKLSKTQDLKDIIGKSKAIQDIINVVHTVAPSYLSILLTGESGSGKQVFAENIHKLSLCSSGPFVDTHCASFSSNLLEDELFGHEKGAYTGAVGKKKGIFEKANGGTLFLDEIGEIPLSTQVKLLKVIEEKKFTPLGGDKEIKSDFRLISATNRDLEEEVKKGNFRQDLFYRIAKMTIKIPPLRERKEDIILLANNFIKKFSAEYKKSSLSLSAAAADALISYAWPGNIRELENVIETAVVLCQGKTIDISNLPLQLRNKENESLDDKLSIKIAPLAEMEKEIIDKLLDANGQDKTKVSKILDITEGNLQKLQRQNFN